MEMLSRTTPARAAARLLAAASVIAFRSPQPAALAALSGSERVAEAAFALDGEDLTGWQTITEEP